MLRKNAYKAFNNEWFKKHQRTLLWFLNTKIIRSATRFMLRINGERSEVKNQDIIRIEPHCITWNVSDHKATEFRTHWKFSKRIYYSLEPIWWLLHCWDLLFADRWFPQLSFGLGTLTVSPDADPETTTCDGFTGASTLAVWSVKRTQNGTFADPTSNSQWCAAAFESYRTDMWDSLYRGCFLYDTSSLSVLAIINFSRTRFFAAGQNTFTNGNSPTYGLYSSNPASNTNLVAADHTSYGSVLLSQDIFPTSFGYSNKYLTLNSSGIAAISKTSITKLAIRENVYDVGTATPTWTPSQDYYGFACYYADSAGTSNDPYLYIVYDVQKSQSIFIGLGE